jgi:hypothetical protein|tara:strand:+ start:299 stop:1150 length:852 start_codon:yes stop_codon:yes gene_type:complete
MKQFIPFNFALSDSLDFEEIKKDIDLTLSKDLLTKIYNNEVTLPTNVSELTDGEVTQFNKLSVDVAIALKLPFGSADGKATRVICIQQYEKFKIITDGNQKIKVGIGIRWTVNVKKNSAKAKVNSLTGIAASAEFGHVDATIRFEQMGMSSSKITNLIPTITTLNTDSYAQLNNSFEEIKKLIHNDDTQISPVVLSVLGDVQAPGDEQIYDEALARVWGLKSISKKWTVKEAMDNVKGESELFQETLKGVYFDISGTTELDEEPIPENAAKARRLLKGFRIVD